MSEKLNKRYETPSAEAMRMARRASIRRGNPAPIALACLTFAGLCASMPYFITTNQKEALYSKGEALSPAAIRRGNYVNSGSKDVGVDPMWDFKKGVRRREGES